MREDKPKGDRGVSYIRISSDKQDVGRQYEDIRRWLAERGLTVMFTVEDVGSRDQPNKRKGFKRLLQMVEARQLDWIVTDSKDRFGSAHSYQFGHFATTLIENGVQLWATNYGELTSIDPATQILSAVDSVRSRDEQLARGHRAITAKLLAAARAEYLGGNPPYGMDIACIRDGVEIWRVLYEGHFQRVKIMPDGERTSYNGEHNFPARDKGDKLFLVVSCDERRLEIVRLIYRWWINEAISVRGICSRLNDMGVNPVFGDFWYQSRLLALIKNPAYCGLPTWNKESKARFYHLEGGQCQQVPLEGGKPAQERHRQKEDWISGERPQCRIVDQETWDLAQAKMLGVHRPGRAPRAEGLWLAGLLYCSGCGRRMSAWTQATKTRFRHPVYCCTSYKRAGKRNPWGCSAHRVRADAIERLLSQYLTDIGKGLDTLLTLDDEGQLLTALEKETDERQLDYLRLMHRAWLEVRGQGQAPPVGQPWSYPTLLEGVQRIDHNDLQARVKAKEAELDKMVEQFSLLTSKLAIERANAKMATLEAEILQLRSELQPLDEALKTCRADLERLAGAVVKARASLTTVTSRHKAVAVARVVSRIVCDFEMVNGDRRWVRVRFEPLVGEERAYPVGDHDGGPSWRASAVELALTRTYPAVRIEQS